MNPLTQTFTEILSGLLYAQFNVKVRSERFKDSLFSSLILFVFMAVSAMVLNDTSIVIVLLVGIVFIGLVYIYHWKTDENRVDLKAAFFYIILSIFYYPIIYYYCGRFSLGAILLLIQLYFCLYFILKFIPGLLISALATSAYIFVISNYDLLEKVGMMTAQNDKTDIAFTTAGFFVTVLTIGSLIRKTIGAYDREQEEAKRLFDDYNRKLYKAGKRNAFNDRYLLSNVATLGVLTEKGDLPGFTAVIFSVDNEDVIEAIPYEYRVETFDVFSRKVLSVIEEDEIFVRQETHTFALILNTVNEYEVKDKLDELIATINMTIFEHLPKERISISAGYSIHTAGLSTTHTMQKAMDNMNIAKHRGGNCKVGGND